MIDKLTTWTETDPTIIHKFSTILGAIIGFVLAIFVSDLAEEDIFPEEEDNGEA